MTQTIRRPLSCLKWNCNVYSEPITDKDRQDLLDELASAGDTCIYALSGIACKGYCIAVKMHTDDELQNYQDIA